MAYNVQVNVQDGNLGLQPGSNQNTICVMGCCLGNNAGGGVPNTLYNFSDPVTAANALVGGELLEEIVYILKASPGATVQAMPLNPTTRGGVGSVTKTGNGSSVIAVSIGPWGQVLITCTTPGALGTAAFTFAVTNPITGVTVTSAPIVSSAGWSSTGFLIPNTFAVWTPTAGSYVAGGTPDTYVIPVNGGVITHPTGTGPAVGSYISSPTDAYKQVIVNFTFAGAVGTSQFTYSLDGGNTTSATITSSATYAIPGTGIVLGISGTAAVGDQHTFQVAPPTFTNTDLSAAGTALTTTYINGFFSSLIGVVGAVASAAAWATQVAAAETIALSFNALNVYPRIFIGGPTLGTVLPNAGGITVDASDNDATVISARAGMSAIHIVPCAGDETMVGYYSGLVFRRNALWSALARAAGNVASQDIGAVEDGSLAGVTNCVRDDFASGLSFFKAGITSVQTYGAGSGVFINRGFCATIATSDYYPLTNARVIDLTCTVMATAARQLNLKRLPTQTRNGIAGTIREDYAQKIEQKVGAALNAGIPIAPLPTGNAVKATPQVTRTNNIYSTGQLFINAAVQPFGYPTQVIATVGMTVQA